MSVVSEGISDPSFLKGILLPDGTSTGTTIVVSLLKGNSKSISLPVDVNIGSCVGPNSLSISSCVIGLAKEGSISNGLVVPSNAGPTGKIPTSANFFSLPLKVAYGINSYSPVSI